MSFQQVEFRAVAALVTRETSCLASLFIRDCARQDRGLETGGRDASTSTTLAGWRTAAGQAGDRDVVQALDTLGGTRAARVYDAVNA